MKIVGIISLAFLIATSAMADTSLSASLRGIWRFQYENASGVVVVAGHSVYRADGTFEVSGFYRDGQGWADLHYSGTWRVAGRNMTMEILETSDPDKFPRHSPITVAILQVTDRFYQYRDPNGRIAAEYRIGSGVCDVMGMKLAAIRAPSAETVPGQLLQPTDCAGG